MGEIREIGECQFARVGGLAYREEAEGVLEKVAVQDPGMLARATLCGARDEGADAERKVDPYCNVCLPASMLAWGSELRFNFRMIILAFDLGSVSSASV